ncbi:tRNA pseudouridine synthase B [Candidatus Magnetomoraceae bacterium gMMP-15]
MQNGILVIDKPEGITSARAVAQVKRILQVKKVGHTGTLDPFATGVLVCCINKATKLAQFFLAGQKRYQAVLHLGIETDTQDLTGNIISKNSGLSFFNNAIEAVFKQFQGEYMQMPPVFSALKHKGQPLYKLARSGRPVQKPARKITIFSLKILNISLPLVSFDVFCSAGTYIRTLCSDIGRELGCGGHLAELRRTFSSGFSINEALALSSLNDLGSEAVKNHIINITDALKYMEPYVAENELKDKIIYGKKITKIDVDSIFENADQDNIKILDENNNLLAILSKKYENNNHKILRFMAQ